MSLEEYRFAMAVQKELRAQLDAAKAEATEHWEDLKFTVTQRDNARSERDELLAMLKRMAMPEVSRCEVNRSMVDVDRECGEHNRCEPCRAALEAEALIARVEGGR